MKANELRIGNLIYGGGQIRKVTEIKNDGCITEPIDDYKPDFSKGINPIPLTEEWLVRFGFDQLESGTYICPNQIVLRKDIKGYLYEIFKGKETLVKHVHQLQNLYFALTGEEL